jgi:hypothetical protein
MPHLGGTEITIAAMDATAKRIPIRVDRRWLISGTETTTIMIS